MHRKTSFGGCPSAAGAPTCSRGKAMAQSTQFAQTAAESERSSPFESECPQERPHGRTSLKSTQRGVSRSKSTQRGVGRSKSTQRVIGSPGGSYGYPSTVDEWAQTDIASSASFGEALVQKNHIQRQIRRRRYTGQQPGTKSTPRPADKPVINR